MLSIIGCGNSNRSDDGAGVYVAQRLIEQLSTAARDDVQVFDGGTAGMDVMFQARGSDSLIIIDASTSGSEAGAIFEVPGEILASVPEPAYSLHDFRWDHAIYAGRKIFKEDFPADITVYLIEAGELSLGLELTAPVKAAADTVVQKIVEKIAAHQRLRARAMTENVSENISDKKSEFKKDVQKTVHILNGTLYMDSELYSTCFNGIESVALLPHNAGFFIMPVHSQASGGRLLKLRNAKGDRVVTATDFFEDCGITYDNERVCVAKWDSDTHALLVDLGCETAGT